MPINISLAYFFTFKFCQQIHLASQRKHQYLQSFTLTNNHYTQMRH